MKQPAGLKLASARPMPQLALKAAKKVLSLRELTKQPGGAKAKISKGKGGC